MKQSLSVIVLTTILSAAPAIAQSWQLVWSDEFDYTGLPDPAKWGYEVGYIRNGELQYYTDQRLENARVENGNLIIETRRDYFNGHEYTSASLHTLNTATWTYGRIEVRAILPTGRGMWPAIWTLGVNLNQVGWPACGEIDIMENVGFDPDRVHGNIHTQAYNHAIGTNKGASILVNEPYNIYHIYRVDWYEDRIEFYVDDNNYFTFNNEYTGWEAWPYFEPQYLLLNAAFGGSWGGMQGVDPGILPQQFHIDYVRVYQQSTLIPPSDLTATALSSNQVQLAWNDNSGNEQSFIVQRKPYNNINDWHTIETLPADTTAYIDTTDLFGLTTYTYRIGAQAP